MQPAIDRESAEHSTGQWDGGSTRTRALENDAKDISEDESLKALAQMFLVNNLGLGGVEMSFLPCIVL